MLIPSEKLCVVHSEGIIQTEVRPLIAPLGDLSVPVRCSNRFKWRAEADLPPLPKISKLHILLAAQISETC